jgi:hypothetical protein
MVSASGHQGGEPVGCGPTGPRLDVRVHPQHERGVVTDTRGDHRHRLTASQQQRCVRVAGVVQADVRDIGVTAGECPVKRA